MKSPPRCYLQMSSVVQFVRAIGEASAHHVHVREQGRHPGQAAVGEGREGGGGISQPPPEDRGPHGGEVASRVHDGREVSVSSGVVEQTLGERSCESFRGATSGHLGESEEEVQGVSEYDPMLQQPKTEIHRVLLFENTPQENEHHAEKQRGSTM